MTAIPVTPSQRSLLFIQEAVPRQDLYNITFRLVFDAAIDLDAVRSSVDRLIRVQPTLRTRFDIIDGEPKAEIVPSMAAPLEIVHVDCVQSDWATTLDAESRRFAARPVDLRTAPLCAFRLLVGPVRTALLCNIHHAISDGVSMRTLLDEFVHGYQRATSAVDDVDIEQREKWLASELVAQCSATQAAIESGELTALANTLTGVPPTLLYPVPERPVDTAFRGRILRTTLPMSTRIELESVAKKLGTTPYCVLLACYSLLLGDYSGNAEVIVGGPFVNRRTIASHDLCGFFVNTLPVVLPATHRTFADHVAEVASRVRQAKRFQSIPFDTLVAEVAPERVGNRNPIFQCMFAMQDNLQTKRELQPGVRMFLEYTHNGTSKFDIWLAATPVTDGLELELEWDSDLLPNRFAHRFFDEFQQLLKQVIAFPERCSAVIVSNAPTRSQCALRAGDATNTADGRGLFALVVESAEKRPDAVAIEQPGAPDITYRELLALAGHAAAGLAQRGVRPGDVVAVAPESTRDTTVAMLAVLWCGAAYLPVDRTQPADRLSYMLAQTRCRFVISSEQVTANDPGRSSMAALVTVGKGLVAPALPSGKDPVYVMFTSGSTGRPKGVHMGPRPLVNLLHWQLEAMEMGSDTRFLQYAPLGFDVSFQEIVPTLVGGGTIYGLGDIDRRDLAAVAEITDKAQLTHVYLPVALLGAFAQAVIDADLALNALRYVSVSGEQLNLDCRSRALLGRLSGTTLMNLYGPTETHAVTACVLKGGRDDHPRHVPIGLPIDGVNVYLLDADRRQVPPGAVGEVFLGGACPAEGYINDEQRSAMAFLTDPFVPGSVMYKTGDLAIFAEDTVVFLGRQDSQVKVRGHRVELGEIEAAAEALPSVAAAAAGVRGAGDTAALFLFVHSVPGAPFDERMLRGTLKKALPTYMVPKHILPVDKIPLTLNGKVDRAALIKAFEHGEIAAPHAVAEDWTPTESEALLSALWTKLLNRAPAGPEDSFFDLGGTSFDVLKMVSALHARTGVRIAVSETFRKPTLAALAAHLDEVRS
jgi:amino acid adenylation domain-containing protein